jgi:hypothetical protein
VQKVWSRSSDWLASPSAGQWWRGEEATGSAGSGDAAAPSSAPGGSSSAPSPAPGAEQAAGGSERPGQRRPAIPTFVGWRARPPACPPSEELKSIVRACTLAHREGRGNFVWLSWEGSNKTPGSPSHGSTALAFTRDFAREFLPWLSAAGAGHCDLILRDFLKQGGCARIGACWVWPSVGSYEQHVSACQQGLGVRESSWDKKWAVPGFTGERYLAYWDQEGRRCWGSAFDPRDEGLAWRTQAPPREWWDPRWESRLHRRWWIHGSPPVWTGPDVRGDAPRAAGGGRRGGQNAAAPSPAPGGGHGRADPGGRSWRSLRDKPNEVPLDAAGRPGTLSRVAQELCCDPPELDMYPSQPPSQRVQWLRRRAVRAYQRRLFVDNMGEVAGVLWILGGVPSGGCWFVVDTRL